MSIFDEDNLIEITQEDIKDAANSAMYLDDRIKKRAFANVLGARLGIKFLKFLGSNASNFDSIYTIHAVLKDADISDIHTDNNITVDVRIAQDEEHLCIPKAQFEFGITPDLYIFLKLSQDYSTAAFIGAISPEEADKSVENENYYFISASTLYNQTSLKAVLEKGKPKSNVKTEDNDVIKAESLLVNFIDGDILHKEKFFVYNILKNSETLRQMFKDFEYFELLSKDLANTEEILSDSVLDVLGAQEIYKNDLSDENFAADVNLDELAIETANDFTEGFIDEDKENEMLEDDEVINGEFKELPDDDSDNNSEDLQDSESENVAGELEELPSDEELASYADNTEDFTAQFEDLSNEDNPTQNEDFSENSQPENTAENIEGFEGFEGLKPENDDNFVSIDDNTQNDGLSDLDKISQEVSFEDAGFEFTPENSDSAETLENSGDLTDLNDFSASDGLTENSQAFEENTAETESDTDVSDFKHEYTDLQTQELQNEEEELSKNSETDTQTEDVNQEEDNEKSENNEGFMPLQELDAPIDLTLPDLAPDDDLPFVGDDSENEEEQNNEPPVQADEEQENQNPDFSAPLEELPPPEPLTEVQEETTEPVQETVEESTNFEQIPQSNDETSEDDSMAGLEEFTPDMAAAYEQANPDLYNPQRPQQIQQNPQQDQILAYNENDFNMSTPVEMPSQNEEIAENQTEEHPQNTQADESSEFDMPTLNLDDFMSDDDNSHSEQPQEADEELKIADYNDTPTSDADANNGGVNLDNLAGGTTAAEDDISNINLDDLDDDTDESNENNEFGNTDVQNTGEASANDFDSIMNNPDFDINELNIDDIDLNDPNLNIDNIDLQDFDINDISSIENIPEMSDTPQEASAAPSQNAEGQPVQNNDYIPDFNGNDQNTIESLYEGNPQGNQGDAINQSFDQNNVNGGVNINSSAKPKNKSKSNIPLLGLLLLVLLCAFCYMKKDLIMEKINAQKGVSVTQDQNMPIEGESKEDKEDAQMLNDNTPTVEQTNQGVGAIPGENGGPQDVASMEQSLHQRGSQANSLPDSGYAKAPEPLSSSNIRKLYWEVPQDLTYNANIVSYLKTIGRTIKLSAQSDLLNATELPYSNKMIVNVTLRKDGSFDNVNATVSSGSKQIDSIVLQSVKAALKYVKAPTAEFRSDSYTFSLIINF